MIVGPAEAFDIFRPDYEGPEEAEPYLAWLRGDQLTGGPITDSVEHLLGKLASAKKVSQLGTQVICHAEATIGLDEHGTCDAMFLLSAHHQGGFSLVRPFSRTILRGPDELTARVIWHTNRDTFRPVDKVFTNHHEESIRLLARLLTEEST